MINRGEAIDDWTVQRASERSIKAEARKKSDWATTFIPIDKSAFLISAVNVEQQSPINFELSALKRRALDKFPLCLSKYKKSLPGTFKNTGTTNKFVPNPPEQHGQKCHVTYSVRDSGSEHALGGLKYAGELHLMHKGLRNASELAVLGVFLKLEDTLTTDNAKKMVFSKEETDVLKELVYCGQSVTGEDHDHTLSSKLPANSCEEVPSSSSHLENVASSFIRYQGSLMTDPYTEGVIWTMFTDQLVITEEQSVGLPTKVQLGNFLDKFLKILC
ncbi:hypothetical protein niasHT_020722 [Heterodera trifolii]|uniref:Carbonic anhydrase n=1 Tax=Heterodera trifolii TaxID=157864 RepID=A0ABD2KMN3_9BILA